MPGLRSPFENMPGFRLPVNMGMAARVLGLEARVFELERKVGKLKIRVDEIP